MNLRLHHGFDLHRSVDHLKKLRILKFEPGNRRSGWRCLFGTTMRGDPKKIATWSARHPQQLPRSPSPLFGVPYLF